MRKLEVKGPVVAPAESKVVCIEISVQIYVLAESSSGTRTAIPVGLKSLILLLIIGLGSEMLNYDYEILTGSSNQWPFGYVVVYTNQSSLGSGEAGPFESVRFPRMIVSAASAGVN